MTSTTRTLPRILAVLQYSQYNGQRRWIINKARKSRYKKIKQIELRIKKNELNTKQNELKFQTDWTENLSKRTKTLPKLTENSA